MQHLSVKHADWNTHVHDSAGDPLFHVPVLATREHMDTSRHLGMPSIDTEDEGGAKSFDGMHANRE